MPNAFTQWVAGLFTNDEQPAHTAVETVEGVMHTHVVTCEQHNTALAVANERCTMLTQALVERDEENARLRELMDNALPMAFNCGKQFATILKLDIPVVPGLAPDGKSAQVTVSGLTLNVYPFTRQLICTIADSTEDATVFDVTDGTIATGYQDQIRGMYERSKAGDEAPRVLSLVGIDRVA